jgi:hypothetical protein
LPIQPVGTDGANGERVPFTTAVLAEIAMLGLDAATLVERYRERTAGRHIADPSAYLLRMARDEAAKRLGVPVTALAGIASGNRSKRAMSQAASVGAAVEPSPAVLKGVVRRARARGQDADALLAAWRESVMGRRVPNADASLLTFEGASRVPTVAGMTMLARSHGRRVTLLAGSQSDVASSPREP